MGIRSDMRRAAKERYEEGEWLSPTFFDSDWHPLGAPNNIYDIQKVLKFIRMIINGEASNIPPIVMYDDCRALTGSHRMAANEIALEFGFNASDIIQTIEFSDITDVPEKDREDIDLYMFTQMYMDAGSLAYPIAQRLFDYKP